MSKFQNKNKSSPKRLESSVQKSSEINKVIKNIKNNLKDEQDIKKRKIIEKCLNQQANILIKPIKTKNKVSPKAQTGSKSSSPKNKRKSCDDDATNKINAKKLCQSPNVPNPLVKKELKIIINKSGSNSTPCSPRKKSPVKKELKIVISSLTSTKNKSPNKEKTNMSPKREKLGLLSPKNGNISRSPNKKISGKGKEKENICTNQPLIKLTRCDSKKNFKKNFLKTKDSPKKSTKPTKQQEGGKMKFKLRIQFKNNKIKNSEDVKVKNISNAKKVHTPPKIPKSSKINKENKNKENPKNKQFKCLLGCNKFFKTLKIRRVHMKKFHTEQLIQCTAKDCSTMLKPQNMQSHIKNAHTSKSKVTCPNCQDQVSSLKNHKRLCSEANQFQCTSQGCSARFETEHARAIHIAKLHQTPEPCPYKFCSTQLRPNGLEGHLRTTHILEKFRCEKCLKEMLGSFVYQHLQEKNCALQAKEKSII